MKKLPWVLAALVTAAALADLGVGLRGDLVPASPGAMAVAKDALARVSKPGDLVVHSPLFSVRELAPLGDLLASPDRPSAALMRSRRVVVLDRADHPMFGLGQPTQVVELQGLGASDAPLSLAIYEPEGGADVPLFELLTALGPDTMRVERGERVSRCTAPRTEGGFGCPGEPEWLYAAQRSLRIEREDRQCIWAHPTTGGTIVLVVPAQPAPPPGRKLRLEVSGGLTDDAAQGTPDGTPVRTDIRQSGESKGRLVVPNQVGWFTATVDIAPDGPVELHVTTSRDGRRHHCLNARVTEVEATP